MSDHILYHILLFNIALSKYFWVLHQTDPLPWANPSPCTLNILVILIYYT